MPSGARSPYFKFFLKTATVVVFFEFVILATPFTRDPGVSMVREALAAEPANFASEIAELGANSASVIIGSIERREMGVSETTAQLRVVRSFAGPLKEGQQIAIKVRAGRVQIGINQPELTGVNRAIFYLSKDEQGDYRCVNDRDGFKPIIHDNVYTNPQNPLETVKLKKYQESLTLVLKSKPAGKVPVIKTRQN